MLGSLSMATITLRSIVIYPHTLTGNNNITEHCDTESRATPHHHHQAYKLSYRICLVRNCPGILIFMCPLADNCIINSYSRSLMSTYTGQGVQEGMRNTNFRLESNPGLMTSKPAHQTQSHNHQTKVCPLIPFPL